MRRLVFRTRALVDVEAAVDWYADEAGMSTVDAFLAALEKAYARIVRHPTMGSPRWAVAVNMAELRSLAVGRFPYLVFYLEKPQYIEVVRVLHSARDIPSSLKVD